MLTGKPRGALQFILGVALLIYSLFDALDGKFTPPTRNETFVFSYAENPDKFLLMLAVCVGCAIALILLGRYEWKNS